MKYNLDREDRGYERDVIEARHVNVEKKTLRRVETIYLQLILLPCHPYPVKSDHFTHSPRRHG